MISGGCCGSLAEFRLIVRISSGSQLVTRSSGLHASQGDASAKTAMENADKDLLNARLWPVQFIFFLFDEGFRTQKGVATEATMTMSAKDAGQLSAI
jgi:hypothetical protein